MRSVAKKRPQKMRQLKRRIMYVVEKFLPSECPKCRHRFEKQNDDWKILMGDIVNGKKVIRETKGYDIIICSHCGNHTARFPLESYQVFDIRIAKKLLANGFVNLQKVEAFGNMARQIHTVSGVAPDVSVEGV